MIIVRTKEFYGLMVPGREVSETGRGMGVVAMPGSIVEQRASEMPPGVAVYHATCGCDARVLWLCYRKRFSQYQRNFEMKAVLPLHKILHSIVWVRPVNGMQHVAKMLVSY